MAATPGQFGPSTLATIVVAQNSIFKKTPDLYAAKTPLLTEIVKMQTADVTPVTGVALNKVNVAWLDASNIVAQGCAPSCDITGPEIGTDAIPMSLTYCSRSSFQVEVEVGNDPYALYKNGIIGYGETVATAMMKAKQVIHEDVASKSLAKLLTFAGANQDATGQYGAVVGTGATATTTTIPAANWNENLFTFLQLEAGINRMVRPYVIDGVQNGLYLRHLNAVPNALNDNQRDQMAKFNLIETVYDYFTFNALGITNTDLVVDGTAVAFAARNRYQVGQLVYPIANMTMTAVPGAVSVDFATGEQVGGPIYNIDVKIQRKCQVITRNGVQVERYFDVYEMTVPYFDLLHDPYRLGGGNNTGVLKFVKGS